METRGTPSRLLRIALGTVMLLGVVLCLPTVSAWADGDAVINEAGVSVKLITRRACKLHAEPDPNSDAAPVEMFKFWYVLPPDRNPPSRRMADLDNITKNDFYRVSAGDSEASFKGWIHKDDVVEWHHRQALRFSSRSSRAELAHFFQTLDAAEKASATGEVAAAFAREPEAQGSDLILMPLLDRKPIEVDGILMEGFQIAFLAGRPGGQGPSTPTPSREGAPTREEVLQDSTIDIVFVIDTTVSMKPRIEMVQKSVAQVAKNLASNEELRGRLRFGLVAYRDRIGDMAAMEYVSKTFCSLPEGKNHDFFLDQLASLTEAGVGSQGYPEDVLAGVVRAMDLPDNGVMQWNPLGWKQIIVVGDSSMKGPHHPDPTEQRSETGKSIDAVKTMAQPAAGAGASEIMERGFVISAVRILGEEGQADQAISEGQYKELCAGRDYNGALLSARDGEDFSAKLTSEIETRIQNFATVVAGGQVTGGQNTGSVPVPLIDLLNLTAESGVDTPPFQQGFCTERDANGDLLFVPHVFVAKGSLMSFNSGLEFLQGQLEAAGEPGNRNVADIVSSMQVMSASLSLAEPITQEMPIERFLKVLLGFPLKNPIFKVTLVDLAAMTQADYDDWVRSVKAVTESLDELIENPSIWIKLHPDARERDDHAFIRLTDLP